MLKRHAGLLDGPNYVSEAWNEGVTAGNMLSELRHAGNRMEPAEDGVFMRRESTKALWPGCAGSIPSGAGEPGKERYGPLRPSTCGVWEKPYRITGPVGAARIKLGACGVICMDRTHGTGKRTGSGFSDLRTKEISLSAGTEKRRSDR